MSAAKHTPGPHDFCRALLKTTLDEMKRMDPDRHIRAEVNGKTKLGGHTTYLVRVTDSRDPGTGTKFPSWGQPGHFRSLNYEVDACCVACAKVDAINAHEREFNLTERA